MPYRPILLPLRHLEWDEFVDLLGKAHAVLGHLDQIMTRRISKKPLTISLICKLHAKILRDSKEAGAFRKRQNWIGPEGCSKEEGYFFPPKFHLVPKLMANLKHYINSKEKDPLIQLAIFFAQLLVIHPFMDGNGRLARALVPIILCQKGLIRQPLFNMNAYFKKHRLKYFEKLFLISEKDDWEGWIRFFLEGIIEEGKKMSSKLLKNRAL